MRRITTAFVLLAGLLFVALPVCGAPKEEPHKGTVEETGKAITVLNPTHGNTARGTVSFTRVDNGIKVVAKLEGLTPGLHGFHVHEYGDCSAPDAESAGGHFDPLRQPHAGPADTRRHVGDLGNIQAGADGRAYYERVDPLILLNGPYSIIGRAVIVHVRPDDLKTQPTGASGARVACGVVGIAKK